MRTLLLLAVALLAGVALGACGGTGDGLSAIAKSCEDAGGTYRGDNVDADEACAVRYADKTHYIPIDFSADRVDTTGDREACAEDDRLWRSSLASRAEAALIKQTKRDSGIFHPRTGICEKTRVRVTAAEQDRIDFSRYSDRAESQFCDGDGSGARRNARRALGVQNSALMRRVIRDSRTLDAQQAANRGLPDSAAQIPAILRSRCNIQNDGPISTGDTDCSDFDTQAEAQKYLSAQSGDPDLLDDDDDGRACEWLP